MSNKTLLSVLLILGLVVTIGFTGCNRGSETPNVNVETEVNQPPANVTINAPVTNEVEVKTTETETINETVTPVNAPANE